MKLRGTAQSAVRTGRGESRERHASSFARAVYWALFSDLTNVCGYTNILGVPYRTCATQTHLTVDSDRVGGARAGRGREERGGRPQERAPARR